MIFWMPVVIICVLLLLLLCLTTQLRVNAAKIDKSNQLVLELSFIFNVILLRYCQLAARKSLHFGIGRWGIIKINLKKSTPAPKKSKPATAKPKVPFSQRLTKFARLLHRHWRELKTELVYLLRSFHRPQLNGKMQIGFQNPMYTGLLFGGYYLITAIWPGLTQRFNLQPVFIRAETNWDFTFRVEFVPLQLIWRGFRCWQIIRQSK